MPPRPRARACCSSTTTTASPTTSRTCCARPAPRSTCAGTTPSRSRRRAPPSRPTSSSRLDRAGRPRRASRASSSAPSPVRCPCSASASATSASSRSYGGVVNRAQRLMHGKVGRVCVLADDPLLTGLPQEFDAGRYHSLAAIEPLPEELEITRPRRRRRGHGRASPHPAPPARRAVPPRIGADPAGRRDRAQLPGDGTAR